MKAVRMSLNRQIQAAEKKHRLRNGMKLENEGPEHLNSKHCEEYEPSGLPRAWRRTMPKDRPEG